MLTLPSRLRALRKAAGLTQKELADKAGCSQQTLVDLEGGRAAWSRFMPAIAEALDTSVEYLQTGEGRNSPVSRQGAIPIVAWPDLGSAALSGSEPDAVDWVECAPVEHSGDTVVCIADDSVAFGMGGTIQAGEWLFIDRAESDSGGLMAVLLPGWQRPEIRELTLSGGSVYLRSPNAALGDEEVAAYRSAQEYLQAAEIGGLSPVPALVLGRVIFRGFPL